ncbi:MAG TPA: 5-oxoprolinase subunit PxpA [Gemmatimonadales bacterium]|nr:5-oxoprolinase subunit PxpA [Gemmatimonadales bacterium]
MFQVDLSADLGEGFGTWDRGVDAELLGLVSSASIACGFHAGDPVRMRRTAALARRHGVAIGAHPGYPDLLGFGRREVAATPEEIAAYVLYQVGALQACAAAEGARVRYVKPHGALYSRAAREPAVAGAIADAVRRVDPGLALLGLAGSALVDAARAAGLRPVPEAFLDRGYAPDGTLLPRDRPGALLDDAGVVAERAVRLVRDHVVAAADGTELRVNAESLCVHGDGAHAAALLRAVRARFLTEGVAVTAFAG